MPTHPATWLLVVALILPGCSGVVAPEADRRVAGEPPYGETLHDEGLLYERTGAALRDAGSYTYERSERAVKGADVVRVDRTMARRQLSAGRSLVRQEHPDRVLVSYTVTGTDAEPGYRYTRLTYPPGENGRNRTSRERYGGNLTGPTEGGLVPAPTGAVLTAEPLHYDGPAMVDGQGTYRYVVRNGSWSDVRYSHYAGDTHIERYRLEVLVRPDGSLARSRLTMRVSAGGRQYVVVERTRYRALGDTAVTPPPWTDDTGGGGSKVRAGAGETR
ncbi:hypothetical protein [Haloglomus litoreum]|uniref:hypothetical protein n=1 Tax=Haloglomus litoreum TaxID=3034026 RepID=UPI0023E80F79|nr:hypothetical protein [Haloglomus sp. DT116]